MSKDAKREKNSGRKVVYTNDPKAAKRDYPDAEIVETPKGFTADVVHGSMVMYTTR